MTMTTLAFTIDRKTLGDALTAAGRVTERRNTIPILSAVLFVIQRDAVRLIATDLDVELQAELPAATTGEGSICIAELSTFVASVKKLKGDSVRITDIGNGRASMVDTSTGATVNLGTFKPSDWPHIKPGDMLASFTLPAAEFAQSFRELSTCVSTEETRYYLNGIFAHQTRDEFGVDVLRFAATDGHKLGRITRALPDGLPKLPDPKAKIQATPGAMPDVIIPRKACGIVDKLTGKKPSFVDARIAVNATKVRIELGRYTLLTKTIDGTFPDYTRVVPYQNPHTLHVDNADAFAATVAGVTAVCDTKGPAVAIGVADNEPVILSAANSEGKRSAAIFEGARLTKGEGFKLDSLEQFSVNAGYLDKLMSLFGSSPVEFRLADAAAPIRIESPDRPDLLIVLMPVRDGSGVTTRAGVERLNESVWQAFERAAPDYAASLRLVNEAEPGVYSKADRKKALAAIGVPITAAIAFLVEGGTDRTLARYMAAAVMGDARAAAIVDALKAGPSGSFRNLGDVEPVTAVPAIAAPVAIELPSREEFEAGDVDETDMCSACGRYGPDCSRDPCPAVIADREEGDEEAEQDLAAVQDLTVEIQIPEPEIAAAEPVDVVKLLTHTEQAVYVSRESWESGLDEMFRYRKDGTEFGGGKTVLRSNIARVVLPRGGADKPVARPAAAPAAVEPVQAAPAVQPVDSDVAARLERLERIVAGLAVPEPVKRDAARLRGIRAYLKARAQRRRIAELERCNATVSRSLLDMTSQWRAAERRAAAHDAAIECRDIALADVARLRVRCDALERLHANSNVLDTAAPRNGSAKPSVVIVEPVGSGPRG